MPSTTSPVAPRVSSMLRMLRLSNRGPSASSKQPSTSPISLRSPFAAMKDRVKSMSSRCLAKLRPNKKTLRQADAPRALQPASLNVSGMLMVAFVANEDPISSSPVRIRTHISSVQEIVPRVTDVSVPEVNTHPTNVHSIVQETGPDDAKNTTITFDDFVPILQRFDEEMQHLNALISTAEKTFHLEDNACAAVLTPLAAYESDCESNFIGSERLSSPSLPNESIYADDDMIDIVMAAAFKELEEEAEAAVEDSSKAWSQEEAVSMWIEDDTKEVDMVDVSLDPIPEVAPEIELVEIAPISVWSPCPSPNAQKTEEVDLADFWIDMDLAIAEAEAMGLWDEIFIKAKEFVC